MMDISGSATHFQDFNKDNTVVQEIFTESVDVDLSQGSYGDVLISGHHQHRQLQSNISELTDNLILCAASSVNPSILDALNIACVVNVAPELPDTPLHSDDIIYHKINILDNSNERILLHFDEAADLIQKMANAGCRTLVYCVAGVSRSASICLAYFMKHHHLTLLDAYNYVKLRRPKIKPNCAFFKQLIDYEKQCFGTTSVRMVFNEFVQMDIPDVYDCDYRFVNQLNSKKRRSQNGRH